MALTTGLSRRSLRRRCAAFLIVVAAACAAVTLFGPVRATSQTGWAVLAVSGQANWRDMTDEGAWHGLELNGRVPDGAEIHTGDDGSAVVAQGLDRIEIRAATSVVVGARGPGNGTTDIGQPSGSATYSVEKRPAGTFSVHTPYVVAVVKGTKFSVNVGAKETTVDVSEGRVSVSDRRSHESVSVAPGQRALAKSSKPGLDVGRTSSNPAAPAVSGTRRAATVAPAKNAGIKSATGTGKANVRGSVDKAGTALDATTGSAAQNLGSGVTDAVDSGLGSGNSSVDSGGDRSSGGSSSDDSGVDSGSSDSSSGDGGGSSDSDAGAKSDAGGASGSGSASPDKGRGLGGAVHEVIGKQL